MSKLYFKSIDDTMCFPLENHIDEARENELSEITLIEAIPDKETKGVIWCKFNAECINKSQCKRVHCMDYTTKTGRGKCDHRGQLYLHGDEVNFKVE